jgi:hypothetical protein
MIGAEINSINWSFYIHDCNEESRNHLMFGQNSFSTLVTKRNERRQWRRLVTAAGLIFLLAFGIRLLMWRDNRFVAREVQANIVISYQTAARYIAHGESLFDKDSSLTDPEFLAHPPGYPLLLAGLFSLFSESDAVIQIAQIIADAVAAVIVFLIAGELLSNPVAFISGLLVALAPQFAYNSVMLLPDSLAVLPILLAIYCFVLACRAPRWWKIFACGALIGISCWLRANALLLSPFVAAAIWLLFPRTIGIRYAIAVIAATISVIAPITIRNFVVFNHVIPLSIGAGQTLLEGIGDYDPTNRFGIPRTDVGIIRLETAEFNRPEYSTTLFGPDGIQRDQSRIKCGMRVIGAHPFWFMSVMIRRAASMLRLERTPIIAANPPVSHPIANLQNLVWKESAIDLVSRGTIGRQTKVVLDEERQIAQIEGDNTKYGEQLISELIPVEPNIDYVLRIPVTMKFGRLNIAVTGEQNKELSGKFIDMDETVEQNAQPLKQVEIPFTSGSNRNIRINVRNGGESGAADIRQAEIFLLGATLHLWERTPRIIIRMIQKLFVTAVILPLVIVGFFALVWARQRHTVTVLLVVPTYYFCVQSALHTEYRYVMVIHYLLFILVSVAIYSLWITVAQLARKIGKAG